MLFFFRRLVVPLVLLLTGLTASLASAQTGYRGIPKQEQPSWCWASAIQNVLAQAGIFESQTSIVAKTNIFRVPADFSVSPSEAARVLRRYRLKVWHVNGILSDKKFFEMLADGNKIIADTMPHGVEHAVVIQGREPSGRIIFSDPLTGNTGTLTLAEFKFFWTWIDTIVIQMPKRENVR